MNSIFKNKILTSIIILFTLTGLISYIAGLSIDVTRDAGKYATVAKEIYQNGNLINLTIHGDAYDQKPPMLFWLGALGFTIGGISNFWFKFPVFILIILGIYWGYKLGESLYNKKTGTLTAILLFFSLIYSLYSMDIHTDTPLQAFVTLSIWQLYEFVKSGKNKHVITGFIGIGLAMLSKGPIGAVIPAFAIGGHILFSKQFKLLEDYRWYLGIVLAGVIVSPAIVGLMNQFGWQGIKFFFWDNMVGRITGSYVKAVNDPFFYFHNLLYQLLPWSLLFYLAAFMEFRGLIKSKFKSVEYITFTGIWIYFGILNSASSQLPNYIFPIIPLMVVLISKWITIAIENRGKLFRLFFTVQNVMVLLQWILIFVLSFYIFPYPRYYYWVIVVIGLFSSAYIYTASKNYYLQLVLPSVIVFACLIFLFNTHIFDYIFSFQASPKAARYFNENSTSADTLYNYEYGQYELFFYSIPQAIQLNNFEKMKNVAGKKGNWIFTDEKGFSDIEKLHLEADTVIHYKHLYLDRGGRFIDPKNRENVLKPMYLIKY